MNYNVELVNNKTGILLGRHTYEKLSSALIATGALLGLMGKNETVRILFNDNVIFTQVGGEL